MSNLKCFGGDDGTLIYYYRCLDCGTVILEDRFNHAYLEAWKCPTCNPTEKFPFKFFTNEEIRQDSAIETWFELVEFI
jgi:phage FluMu protein Com